MKALRGASIVAVSMACLLSLVPSATAVEPPNHVHLRSIVVKPPQPGQPGPDPLKDACGVALDAEGRTFVSNYYQHLVYVFAPPEEGVYEFLGRIEIPEPPLAPTGKPFDGPCDLALDPAGNLYVNNWHADVVRFIPTAPGAVTYGTGEVIDPNHPTGVAVNPADGRVFVDERSSVAEYAAAPTAGASPLRRIGAGEIGDGYGVAVSGFEGAGENPGTEGWVYVGDAADGTLKVFDPAVSLSTPVQTIDGAGTPHGGFRHLADTDIAVDPRDGHVYVVDNREPGFELPEAVVYEFSPRGHYRGPVPGAVANGFPSELVDAEPSAIAITPLGEVLVTSGNYFDDGTTHKDSEVQVFGPAAAVPTAILTASRSGSGEGTVFSSDPAGLRCGTACVGEFPLGRTIELTAAPALHSRFAGWSGCPQTLAGGRCALTLGGDAAVSADFEPAQQQPLQVTVRGSGVGSVTSLPSGIECGSQCTAEFDEGALVTLRATAGAGSAFAGWSGCDSEPTVGTCRISVSGARSVAAKFEAAAILPPPQIADPPPRTISVSIAGTDGAAGTVTTSPGGTCPVSCAGAHPEGTVVTLEARPGPGSAFQGWGGCDSVDAERCVVNLGADRTVVAAFGPGDAGPLRLAGIAVHRASADLRVVVPKPGELSTASSLLRPADALPVSAGVVRLHLRLRAAAARTLSRSAKHRLPVAVVLSFQPFDGGTPVAARKTIVFGARPQSGGRR